MFIFDMKNSVSRVAFVSGAVMALAWIVPIHGAEGEGHFVPDAALQEFMPEGLSSPDAEQRSLVNELAAMVYSLRVRYDEEGNVVTVHVSNHGVDIPQKVEDKESYKKERTGLDDAAFQRLAELPRLKGLRVLQQRLVKEDSSFAFLASKPEMEIVAIEHFEGNDTGEFMLHLNGLENLRWLELKHLFGLNGTKVGELGEFPQLKRLELDNASAQAPDALTFLKKNPTVIDFELHRSAMNNDQIGEIVEALPNLQRFALKPAGNKPFDAGCFVHISKLENLVSLGLHHWKQDMLFWENGLEHLVKMSTLKHLEMPGDFKEHEAMKKLLEARPDLDFQKVFAADFDEPWPGH